MKKGFWRKYAGRYATSNLLRRAVRRRRSILTGWRAGKLYVATIVEIIIYRKSNTFTILLLRQASVEFLQCRSVKDTVCSGLRPSTNVTVCSLLSKTEMQQNDLWKSTHRHAEPAVDSSSIPLKSFSHSYRRTLTHNDGPSFLESCSRFTSHNNEQH